MTTIADPAKEYVNTLLQAIKSTKNAKAILAQAAQRWADKENDAFRQWLRSGSSEHLEFMRFCDRVLVALEKVAA